MPCSASTRRPRILPSSVQRQFAGHDLVAAVRIAEESLRARRHPFDRTSAAAPRGPKHQRVLGINRAFHAEAAADVRRDYPHPDLGQFQHVPGDMRAGAVRVLRGAVERVAVVLGMKLAERGARLDRIGVDPVVDQPDRGDVLRLCEGSISRFLAAHHQGNGDIVRRLVPDRRRARFDGVFHGDDGRKLLVLDLDQFGGVACLRQRFGDDERDTVADRAHPPAAEDRAHGAKAFRPAHVLRHHRNEAAEPVRLDVGAGQYGQHAGGCLRPGSVDAFDEGVRVRRHHHDTVTLSREIDVVHVAAAAGDEAGIFQPRNGLANAEFSHALFLLDQARQRPGACIRLWLCGPSGIDLYSLCRE